MSKGSRQQAVGSTPAGRGSGQQVVGSGSGQRETDLSLELLPAAYCLPPTASCRLLPPAAYC